MLSFNYTFVCSLNSEKHPHVLSSFQKLSVCDLADFLGIHQCPPMPRELSEFENLYTSDTGLSDTFPLVQSLHNGLILTMVT